VVARAAMKSRQRIVSDEEFPGFLAPARLCLEQPGLDVAPAVQARLQAARRSTYIGRIARAGGHGNSWLADRSEQRAHQSVSACRRCESGAKVSAGHCHGLGGCEFFHVDWDFSAPIR